MGYFRRKPDRARIREFKRDTGAADDELTPWIAVNDVGGVAQRETAYLRFSCGDRSVKSQRLIGIFAAAFEPDPDGSQAHLQLTLQAELTWFDENLRAPDIDEKRAIFWFKSSATECMAHIWSLVWLLRERGMAVFVQRVERPGKVVYEDENQVAAVPWRDSGVE